MDIGIAQALLLVVAGFAAGAVNAIAGGGSLISFPALLATGLPSVTANVTNTVALLPGYLGGSIGYRRELQGQRSRAQVLSLTTALGGLVGAFLIVYTPPGVFEAIVPFLILFSCALLAAQPQLSKRLRPPATGGEGERSPRLHLPSFAAAVYGGYFGAGMGIMVLAILALTVADTTQRLNALKGVLSLVINTVAAVFFLLFGPVAWTAAIIMALTTFAGGQAGARVARRLSSSLLRAVVIVFGVAVAIVLLVN